MMQARTLIANKALELHQQGHLAEAALLYEQALAGDPEPLPMVQYYAGMAYLTAGKPRKAVELLGRAASAVNRADFHLGHGNALYALKWHARAVEALERSARLDPHQCHDMVQSRQRGTGGARR